ncbi:hypothetical protein [Neopusillimonas maritima]|uniref:Cystatin domain-containing protein n=1 Tax=Neopusillimonas maritima TaxID=2026239 RepID=A0ABX9MXY8_9BURK|nr:hypothetical protein [Neopusillimonas maritima]RII83850.1 hypothetical protein CJO09_00995 [Neopusillimonas maritima]
MKLKTIILIPAVSLFVAGCGSSGPSEGDIEKHVRDAWKQQVKMLSLFAGPEGTKKAENAIKDVSLEQCEPHENEQIYQCKVSVTIELDGKKDTNVIKPFFKKEFDEWVPVGNVLKD